MELELQETKNQVELAKKENGSLRIKLLEAGQDVKRDYNNKDLENKKIINKLNEDLAAIASEIRDEKKSNSRLQN